MAGFEGCCGFVGSGLAVTFIPMQAAIIPSNPPPMLTNLTVQRCQMFTVSHCLINHLINHVAFNRS